MQFLYGAREHAGKVAKQAEGKASKARQTKQGKEARKQREGNKKEGIGRTDGRVEHDGLFASLATRTDGNHLLHREGRKVIIYSGRAEKEGRK